MYYMWLASFPGSAQLSTDCSVLLCSVLHVTGLVSRLRPAFHCLQVPMTQDSTTNFICSTFGTVKPFYVMLTGAQDNTSSTISTVKPLCVMLTGIHDNTSSTISTVKPFCMLGSVALQLGVTLVLTVTQVDVFINLYRTTSVPPWCSETYLCNIDPWESVALCLIYISHFMGGFHKVGSCSTVSLFKDSLMLQLYSTSVFIYLLSIVLSCKDSIRKCANLLDLTTIRYIASCGQVC